MDIESLENMLKKAENEQKQLDSVEGDMSIYDYNQNYSTLNDIASSRLACKDSEVISMAKQIALQEDMLMTAKNTVLKCLFKIEYNIFEEKINTRSDPRDKIFELYNALAAYSSALHNSKQTTQILASHLLVGDKIYGTDTEGRRFFRRKYAINQFPTTDTELKEQVFGNGEFFDDENVRHDLIHNDARKRFLITDEPLREFFVNNLGYQDVDLVKRSTFAANYEIISDPRYYSDEFMNHKPYESIQDNRFEDIVTLYTMYPLGFNKIFKKSREAKIISEDKMIPVSDITKYYDSHKKKHGDILTKIYPYIKLKDPK